LYAFIIHVISILFYLVSTWEVKEEEKEQVNTKWKGDLIWAFAVLVVPSSFGQHKKTPNRSNQLGPEKVIYVVLAHVTSQIFLEYYSC